MDRRKFLGLASVAGLTLAARGALASPAARAVRSALGGRPPLLLTIHAGGGWDPTSLCDPKGGAVNRQFAARDIVTTAHGHRVAPHPEIRRFFARHGERLLVINGVDTGTRNHDDGLRHTGSGRRADAPSLAALVAASHGQDLALPYISFGGHDETLGVVPRVRSGDGEAARLANPDRVDPDAGPTLFDLGDDGPVFSATLDPDAVRRLHRHLPALDDSDNPLIRQIQIAMAAHRAGLTAAVNLELHGFDTHEDHDAQHTPRLVQLLRGLEFIREEADRQQLGDDYLAVVTSEFGRAPTYNAHDGKDHWPVTSVLAMGKGITGRTIGATSDRLEALAVDPRTLAVDPRGVHITPAHVHHNLRRLTGVADGPLARRYPLGVPDELDLLGPSAARQRPLVA